MTELKVVYADRRESRPDYKDIAWVEYNTLHWLDEADNRIVKSKTLPISVHVAPKQMRIDFLFSEDSQIMPKRLYMMALAKSLIPSVMPAPMTSQKQEQKGILVMVQGNPENREAMRNFLESSEMRELLPEDAIRLMAGTLADA